jgi:hypothetical protein
MTKAAPGPIFRARYETACHGIAVHVAELLHELVFAPNIEIVVAGLPEWFGGTQRQRARDGLLQRLHGSRKNASFRFAD